MSIHLLCCRRYTRKLYLCSTKTYRSWVPRRRLANTIETYRNGRDERARVTDYNLWTSSRSDICIKFLWIYMTVAVVQIFNLHCNFYMHDPCSLINFTHVHMQHSLYHGSLRFGTKKQKYRKSIFNQIAVLFCNRIVYVQQKHFAQYITYTAP